MRIPLTRFSQRSCVDFLRKFDNWPSHRIKMGQIVSTENPQLIIHWMQCLDGQTERTRSEELIGNHDGVELTLMKCLGISRSVYVFERNNIYKSFRRDVTFCFLLPKQPTAFLYFLRNLYLRRSVYKCESCDD